MSMPWWDSGRNERNIARARVDVVLAPIATTWRATEVKVVTKCEFMSRTVELRGSEYSRQICSK